MTRDTLQTLLTQHAAWLRGDPDGARADLRGATLRRADLTSADLTSADLTSADLRHATLRGADLTSADLRHANLTSADLTSADLRGATLRGADLTSAILRGATLTGADLRHATLRGADLRGAWLPTGDCWEQYLAEVVPALCVAGGHPLAVVAAAWDCHTWENCPMAVAFGVQSLDAIPLLYHPRVAQFIQLFDSGLIPPPQKG
jgi:uncharacterized protein YjbI with pentapeptide repeats